MFARWIGQTARGLRHFFPEGRSHTCTSVRELGRSFQSTDRKAELYTGTVVRRGSEPIASPGAPSVRMLAACAWLLGACGSRATPAPTTPPQVEKPIDQCVEPTGADARGLLPTFADQLAAALPAYASGPIVVLNLDTGDLRTVCGDAAVDATRDWARLVQDPARHGAVCSDKAVFTRCGIVCGQVIPGQEALEIELQNTVPPRITNVVFGSSQALPRLAYYIHAFKKVLAHPECPSRPLRTLSR
jgi:hypothetical protein